MTADNADAGGSPSDAAALEAVLVRFETAWKGDAPPQLDAFLSGTGSPRGVLLRELIYVDLECRLTHGQPVRVEEYLRCYPELADDIPYCLDLLAREFYFRQRTEPQLGFAEYEQRFPKFGSELRRVVATIVPRTGPGRLSRFSARLNCPHCHNPIEIVAESAQEEVICPSCGSSLKLDGGQTMTWDKQRLPHIEQFELLEAVGRGAFGTVYKARDSQLQRLVAIKIPRSGVLTTDEDEDRFVREARNAAQLQHRGIVTVFSVGRTETFPYLISEFVDGVTLAQYLTAKRFTMREAARLIQEIALGLQHAHEHGVIHRDLKPSNIMLTPGGQPRIMDFGCAKRDAGEITMTLDGQVLGTPAYMSPEQAKGQAHTADARSDIYSIGVILFQLLTGELPFRGDVRMLLHQVIHDEPPHPRRLNDKIPRDLDTICLKCLSKEPQRRYVTAGELAADLQRFLEGQPILARPVGRMERVCRWCRRNPTVAGLSSLAVLLLLLTAIVSTVAYFRESQHAIAFANLATTEREAGQRAQRLALEKWKLAEQEKSASKKADTNARMAAVEALRANRLADSAQMQMKQAQRHLYAAHMNLAQSAWEDARVGQTVRLMNLYQPAKGQASGVDDLRGFEWHYWNRLIHSYQMSLEGHSGPVSGLAFSPDGKRLASAGHDQTVKVWDASSGKESLTLNGHIGAVTSVVFSPDARRLASSGHDQTVRVWDATSGDQTLILKGHSGIVTSVAFSADGKRLASAGGETRSSSKPGEIKVWDATSGQDLLTLKGHYGQFRSVAFSPDGMRLAASGEDATVKVWDANSGQPMLTLNGHMNTVGCVVFSPDGKRLASASDDLTVKVWDAISGQQMLTLKGHKRGVWSVAFSPDGQRLASAGYDETIRVWDANSGQEMLTLKGHTSWIGGVAFSPDGERLASASGDRTVKVWDATSSQETRTLRGHAGSVTCVAFSRDGKRLVAASGDLFQNAKPGELKVWDIASGEKTLTLTGHSGPVWSAVFSPDGKQLASAGEDQSVRVWDASSGQQILMVQGHPGPVRSVAFSPDGKRLASAGSHQTLKVWDATTGQEALTLKGHIGQVWSVAYCPNGKRLVSASEDKTIKVWDASNGREIHTLQGHAAPVSCVVFSPDGKRLASASDDRTVKVWNALSGQLLLTLKGHTEGITSVAFNADGNRLASTGWDRMVKVWDVTSGQEVLTFKGHDNKVQGVAFSPDDKSLAWANWDGTVMVWEAGATRPWSSPTAAESVQFTIDLVFEQLRVGDDASRRFDFSSSRKSYQRGISDLTEYTERTKQNRFGSQLTLLKSKIALCELSERAVLDLDFALAQNKADVAGLLVTRCQALLAYASSVSLEIPAAVREKWSTGQLSHELLRDAIRTAEKLRTLEPATSSSLYDSGRLYSLCLKRLSNLDLPDKDGMAEDLRSKALAALEAAVVAGFEGEDRLARSPDFEPLRGVPEFIALVKKLPRANLAYRPANAAWPRASSSHVSRYDRNEKANDGIINYDKAALNRWTAYESATPSDWLQIEFEQETEFSRVELALYDEDPTGGVQLPASYTVQYWDGTDWKDASEQKKSPEVPKPNAINEIHFTRVKSKKVRVVFTHQGTSRSGVTEIMVWP